MIISGSRKPPYFGAALVALFQLPDSGRVRLPLYQCCYHIRMPNVLPTVIAIFTLAQSLTSFLVPAARPVIAPQVFQITTDSSQQNGPHIDDDLVAYSNWGGTQGIDIWGTI